MGLEPSVYLDNMISDIKKLWNTMEISYDDFIRTTETRHEERVQKIFQKLYDQGDIYLESMKGIIVWSVKLLDRISTRRS